MKVWVPFSPFSIASYTKSSIRNSTLFSDALESALRIWGRSDDHALVRTQNLPWLQHAVDYAPLKPTSAEFTLDQ